MVLLLWLDGFGGFWVGGSKLSFLSHGHGAEEVGLGFRELGVVWFLVCFV